MYRKTKAPKTSMKGAKQIQGEAIETKIMRITTNKEPITDGAPIMYTERKDGVRPEMNIRTDRWEFAVEGMDKVTKDNLAKRQDGINKRFNEQTEKFEKKTKSKDGGTESTGGTAET